MVVDEEYLKSLGNGHKIAVYDASLGKRYRVVVFYAGSIYPIFWLRLCKDGSLYCGVRDTNARKYKKGTAITTNSALTIQLEDDREFVNCDEKINTKISFHGSGKIHDVGYGETTNRIPISEINQQSELFKVVFKELSRFDKRESDHKGAQTDLCVLTEIPVNHTLLLNAFIAPSDKVEFIEFNGGVNQFTAVLEYKNLPNVGDISIQLCFSPSLEVAVSDVSLMIWPMLDNS